MLTKEFLQARKRHLLAKKEQVTAYLKKAAGKPLDVHGRYKQDIQLPLITASLARMRSGRYGICVDCDEEIPQKRLETRPEVIRCVSCQKTREEAPPC